jgi:hypothetical protein
MAKVARRWPGQMPQLAESAVGSRPSAMGAGPPRRQLRATHSSHRRDVDFGWTAPIARCWHAPPYAGQIATTPAVRFLPFNHCGLLPRMYVGPARERRCIFLGIWGHVSLVARPAVESSSYSPSGSAVVGRAGNMVWFWTPQKWARQAGRPTPPLSRAFPLDLQQAPEAAGLL